MSESFTNPVPYHVAYQEVVRNHLWSLVPLAKDRGWAPELGAALKKMDRILHIYPQYGEPLRDLELKPAQLWIAAFTPLVARYVLDEAKRVVIVVYSAAILPKLGR
jgi:hypothetical protein